MKQNSNQYIVGLDVIRIIAMILVVTVHATTFNDWTSIQHDITILNFFATFSRQISFACVPLFIALTGYCLQNKTPSIKYYAKILRVIIEYSLCSVIVGFFRILYFGETFTFLSFIKSLIFFNLAPYSWYINMYIGLFLLIPFLNMIYNALQTKQTKTLFLLVLIVVFSLPSTVTLFSWNYWTNAYPILFYYVGCYLKELNLTVKKRWLIILLLCIPAFPTLISMFNIPYTSTENHNNIFCLLITVLIFIIFKDIVVGKNKCVSTILKIISKCSLSFFLISYIFDKLFQYEIFVANGLQTFYQKLPHLLYTVPCTIVLSIIVSIITSFISGWLVKLINIIMSKIYKTKIFMRAINK